MPLRAVVIGLGAVDFSRDNYAAGHTLVGISMGAAAGLLYASGEDMVDAIVSDSCFPAFTRWLVPGACHGQTYSVYPCQYIKKVVTFLKTMPGLVSLKLSEVYSINGG